LRRDRQRNDKEETLTEGERVSFTIEQDRGKTHAANLKAV
jgi:cold shock CspA family protein